MAKQQQYKFFKNFVSENIRFCLHNLLTKKLILHIYAIKKHFMHTNYKVQ